MAVTSFYVPFKNVTCTYAQMYSLPVLPNTVATGGYLHLN